MKKMDKKAFTLIELLVVIAVVGILVLLAAPRFTGYTQKAERIRIQHDTKVMEEEVGTVLINGDDEFNEWENNSKDYLNQLVQDNELFAKEGHVVDPIDGNYKIIPEKYKGKINTKLKGTFYANSDGKVYYEHGKGPGYSDKEIDDLVNNCDFIPIADADELNNVRYKRIETYGKGTKWERKCEGGLDKKYIQVKNVDLSGYSEEGWKPIGTNSSSKFRGTYDGGNYVITGLEVKGEDKDFQGLFGYADGAIISNVGLIDNKVTGGHYVGGLVGYAGSQLRSTKISNSYATGSVTGNNLRVGGLVGQANSITITNSYATGSVTGKEYVGGLVGDALSITMENSYATGSVTGSGDRAGGLVGRAENSITITNSYATGSVTGKEYVGGLVGYAGSITIENSYTTGPVTGSGQQGRVGGLVGYAGTGSIIEKSYATGSVTGSGYGYVGGLVGYAGQGTKISSSYVTGSVKSSGSNIGGLVGLANSITITNSYATGSVTGASIGAISVNNRDVGGLVGWAAGGITTIENSYATGEVTGTRDVGGLVGGKYQDAAVTVTHSYATGSVTGNRDVGGLVGGKYQDAAVTVTHSYWDISTTGQISSYGGGEGKITNDMMKQTTYTDWDFDNVWKIDDGKYPTLR